MHNTLGICLVDTSRLNEAVAVWRSGKRWSRNPDIYANLAIAYEERGVVEKAIFHFRRAQEIDPNYYWACRGLGRIYCARGEWDKAIEQLERQVKLAPKDAWGHYALGSCYVRKDKVEKGREHLRRALELDPAGDAGRRAFQSLMQIDE